MSIFAITFMQAPTLPKPDFLLVPHVPFAPFVALSLLIKRAPPLYIKTVPLPAPPALPGDKDSKIEDTWHPLYYIGAEF